MAQNYYPTAQGIIDAAFGHIRAVDPEGSLTPTTTMRTTALVVLNQIVLSWQAKGLHVWCLKNGTLTLVAGQTSYTLGPGGDLVIQRPQAILQAWLHNTSADTDPIPLQIIGREQYNTYTSKEVESTPNAIFYDRQYDLPASNSGTNAKGNLFVYPAPIAAVASANTLQFVYSRPIQDFSAVSDSLDFPQENYSALTWTLAAHLCPSYGVPVMYWDRIKAQAKEERELVEGWDSENDSMLITPAKQ
jgi:hypothetical protein